MPSISDKLKSLGVEVGTENLLTSTPRKSYSLETVLGGQTLQTRQGETFVVEERRITGSLHGQASLEINARLHALADWAGEAHIGELSAQDFAFLDTETTGLSGGAGTYAFLVGVGRFEAQDFHLAQFFLRDPGEEPAQLFALEEFLAPCQAIVTFNGKSFDLPLLKTRYIMQGWQAPFGDLAHLDLLQLARRLWRNRLPSRTLANLEAQILGTTRGQEDVPGWDIPRLYMQYLRDGDPEPLKNVFYHNAMDVISLAALMNHMANLLDDPIGVGGEHGVDLIALAELFESIGRLDTATRLYIHGLDHDDAQAQRLPKHVLLRAIQRLALIYKRQENWQDAVGLWQQAARHGHLEAYLELAKCFEHRFNDYDEAIRWTQLALELVESPRLDFDASALNTYERRRWLDNLSHRLARLHRKANRSS
jgi:uncharacterized protein YprB with RNaseH-like and TPR domain